MKRNQKSFTRLVAAFCTVAMVLALLPPPVLAAEGESLPTITVDTVTVQQGESCYVHVQAENLDTLQLLMLALEYDKSALTLEHSSLVDMEMGGINTSEEGRIQLSVMDASGVSGSAVLMVLVFRADEAANVGSYPLTLSVLEARGADYKEITMEKASGSLIIEEPKATQAYFRLQGSNAVNAGEELTVQLSSGNLGNLAAGQFSFNYDSNYLVFKEAELLSGFDVEDATFSVNDRREGQVMMAYVAPVAAETGNLLQLTFTALKGTTEPTVITCTPTSLYDQDGDRIYAAFSPSLKITINEMIEPELPMFWIEGENGLSTDSTTILRAKVEGSSGLAAADFTLFYDATLLKCISAKEMQYSGDDLEDVNVFLNPNYTEGIIEFSLFAPNGITQDTAMIEIELQAVSHTDASTVISATTVEPVDAKSEPVELNIMEKTLVITVPSYTVTFLNWDGAMLSTQIVRYLEAAAAPTAQRAYTDEFHYKHTGWDRDITAVTEEMTVIAQYEAFPHTYGSWTKLDELVHVNNCTDCGHTKQANHVWSSWDGNTGIRTCTDCAAEELCSHVWGNVADLGDGMHGRQCETCSFIEKSTHNWGSWSKVSDDAHKRSCSNCGAEEYGAHGYGTCEDNGDGSHTLICSWCGKVTRATHNWSSWTNGSRTCTECMAVETCSHTWGSVVDLGDGTHGRQCETCSFIEKSTHNWSSWGEESDDTHKRSCSSCGAEERGAHGYGTCEDNGDGSHTLICSWCGKVTSATHNWSSWANGSRSCDDCMATENCSHILGDCIDLGDGRHGWMCITCDFITVDWHSWESWNDAGDGSHKRICYSCGLEECEAHEYSSWTDAGDGSHNRICVKCAAVDKDMHNWSAWDNNTSSRTCEDCNAEEFCNHSWGEGIDVGGGQHGRQCTICYFIEMAWHDWGSWNDTGDGSHKRSCTVCGVSESEAHGYGSWRDACDGSHDRICVKCAAVDKAMHNWSVWSSDTGTRVCNDCAATETCNHSWGSWSDAGDGRHSRICSRCAAVDKVTHNWSVFPDEVGGRFCIDCGLEEYCNHVWGNWSDAGDGTHKHVCSSCDAIEKEEHRYSSWTDLGDGSHSRACIQCAAAEKMTHNWSAWSSDTGSRICSDCNAEEVCIHNWSSWNSDGEDTHKHTCAVCGVSERQVHTWENHMCKVCGQEDAYLSLEQNTVTVFAIKIPEHTKILVAGYTNSGKMIGYGAGVWGTMTSLTVDLTNADQVSKICVFFLDSAWRPVRTPLSVKGSSGSLL